MDGIADDRETIEASGKTVDEAIENGLAELGLERQDVSVEVLSAGRPGLFGIGGEAARVRLSTVPAEEAEGAGPEGVGPEGDDVGFAKEVLETLLSGMGIEATVSVRAPVSAGDGLGLTKAVLDISSGGDLGVLIGRRGATMASLQYVINLMVSRRYKNQSPFAIDVDGYRQRREESLRALAFRMAERVRSTGRSVTLEPMPANERRIVHLALSNDPTVSTASVGEGESRKVAISVRR